MPLVEEIITSGKVYTAEEMHRMGVVDVLAENGEGERAVYDYIREHSRRRNARNAIAAVRQDVFGVSKELLEKTGERWVKTALSLSDADLRTIDRLVRSQSAKLVTEAAPSANEA
jgi:DSF synthase